MAIGMKPVCEWWALGPCLVRLVRLAPPGTFVPPWPLGNGPEPGWSLWPWDATHGARAWQGALGLASMGREGGRACVGKPQRGAELESLRGGWGSGSGALPSRTTTTCCWRWNGTRPSPTESSSSRRSSGGSKTGMCLDQLPHLGPHTDVCACAGLASAPCTNAKNKHILCAHMCVVYTHDCANTDDHRHVM